MDDRRIRLQLTDEERAEVLGIRILDAALSHRLKEPGGTRGDPEFTIQELDDLSIYVATRATQSSCPRRRRLLDGICEKITQAIQRPTGDVAGIHASDPPPLAAAYRPDPKRMQMFDMLAQAFEVDVLSGKTDPQARLDRLLAKRIDWQRRVPITLSDWRKEMVLALALAGFVPEICDLIVSQPPTRRKFWLTVWQIHRPLKAVVAVRPLATDELTAAQLRELWGMLFRLEMQFTHGLGPTVGCTISDEILLTRRIALNEARVTRAAGVAGSAQQAKADDLAAFDEAVTE